MIWTFTAFYSNECVTIHNIAAPSPDLAIGIYRKKLKKIMEGEEATLVHLTMEEYKE